MARVSRPGADIQTSGDKRAARAIAAARARFNQALADRDMAAIAEILCEDCTLTPGDDAELMAGRQAQLDAWRLLMGQASDLAYVRSAKRIEVGSDGLLAAETGRWTGAWSSDGVRVRYGGRYFAKWRLEGDDWRIAAEVFVTLSRETGVK
jgi:ketosteroid isomerase-like protein